MIDDVIFPAEHRFSCDRACDNMSPLSEGDPPLEGGGSKARINVTCCVNFLTGSISPRSQALTSACVACAASDAG